MGVTPAPSPLLLRPVPVYVRDGITGLPGVSPKSTGQRVREQHPGPHLEGNEMETRTFQGMCAEAPVRQQDQARRLQRAAWPAPRGSGQKPGRIRASPKVGKTGLSPARDSPTNLGQNQRRAPARPPAQPPWQGTGSSAGTPDAREWAGRAEPLCVRARSRTARPRQARTRQPSTTVLSGGQTISPFRLRAARLAPLPLCLPGS